jgi:adhesin/invasin
LPSEVDVTVTTGLGGSATSTNDQYTFIPFSTATSSLFLSSSTIPSGSSISVVLQVNDVHDNNLANPNLTVAFQLANSTGGQGTFGPVTYNNVTNTYSALFTATIAGNNSIVATIDGSKLTSRAPAISVLPGQASLATSYVTLSSSTVQAGGTITATLHTVDAAGNKETSGGLLGLGINFYLANNNVENGTFGGFATDNNNGTYSITFTGMIPGTNTVVATIGGSNVALTAPVTVVPGTANAATSFVSISPSSGTVVSGMGTTVTLQAVDGLGNYETKGGLKVAFGLGGTGTGSGTFRNIIDNGNGTYSATFTGTTAGTNSIVAYINGVQIGFSGFASVTVTPGQVSLAASAIQLLQTSLTAGDSITVLFQAKDAAGNIVSAGNLGVGFYLTNSTGAQGTFSQASYNGNGQYSATFMGTITGVNKIGASIDGLALTSILPTIQITPGAVSLANSTVLVPIYTVGINGTTTVTLQTEDSYGNKLHTGGLSVLLLLLNPNGGSGTFTKVTDNHNGTYTATFKGLTFGDNEIFASINDEVVTSNPALIKII